MLAKKLFLACVLLCAAFLAFVALQKPSAGRIALFAYGTDLGMATMKARAGGFGNATAALAEGYLVAFQSSQNSAFGVANLVPSAAASAPGAVYWLTPAQMEALEHTEGVPGFYSRQAVMVRLADGRMVNATTHVLAGNARPVAPSRPTVLAISDGLAQFGYGSAEQDALAKAALQAGN